MTTPQNAIKSLIRYGWSERDIADSSGASQPTINRLKNGRQTKLSFEVGMKLLKLHERIRRGKSKSRRR